MARPTKPENKNNPLRQLRALMGGTAAITQARLAERCDIPVPTIRAIEAGQRPFSQAVRQKIERMTGASWDEKKERWVSLSLRFHRDGIRFDFNPSTRSDIDAYRKRMTQGSLDANRDRDAVKIRIDALFDEIRPRHWMRLLARLQDFLEELQEEFGPALKNKRELKRVFTGTAYTFQARTEHPTPELLKYRLQMAKQYTEQTKHVRSDGSWVVTFGSAESDPQR